MVADARRGDVLLIQLDPTKGKEIRKTRPCLVVSPDELNRAAGTYIIAPMSTGSHPYPYRVPCRFASKVGHIILDQVRAIDRGRAVKKLGRLPDGTVRRALSILQEMFAAS